jgi:hypothetical protein
MAINPTLQYPKPIFPMFHHSNIPIGAKPLTCAFLSNHPNVGQARNINFIFGKGVKK